jgi:hypothetical protein
MRLTVILVFFSVALAAVGPAAARVPTQWKNCKAVNARYPHGVGMVGAHDKSAGVPVTNFKRSSKLYRVATGYNKGLDRDKDGVVCEKL